MGVRGCRYSVPVRIQPALLGTAVLVVTYWLAQGIRTSTDTAGLLCSACRQFFARTVAAYFLITTGSLPQPDRLLRIFTSTSILSHTTFLSCKASASLRLAFNRTLARLEHLAVAPVLSFPALGHACLSLGLIASTRRSSAAHLSHHLEAPFSFTRHSRAPT